MKKSPVLSRLLSYTKPYSRYLIFALLAAVCSVTLSLLAPILIGRAVDAIVGPGEVDFDRVLRELAYLAAAVAGSAVFSWVMALATNKISYLTLRDLRAEAFRHLNRLPLKYLDGHAHGDLMSRLINDIEQISDGLIQGFTQLFTGVITIAGTLIFMMAVNYAIALVVIVVTPLSLFVASFIAKRSHRLFREQSATRGELTGYVEEMLSGQRVVKAFRYEDDAEVKFREINSRLYVSGVKSQFYSSITNPATRFVNGIVYTAVGLTGAFSVLGMLGFGPKLTVGKLTGFLSYASQYTKPFNEITGVVTELQTAFAAASRVFQLLDEPAESSDEGNAVLRDADGSVELDRVYFSYSPERPLIEDFSLWVPPGKRVAIVGPTGCGKTTLINLLMRFYDVTGGEIRVSNLPVRSVTRQSLRRNFGMVLQESWLFTGSVRDNIAYGLPDATLDEVVAAAKAAHAHGFIKRLPQGYDTLLSEDGGNLSEGQRQLLCIARVMLVRPPILILDEATSNIDTRTEIQIQKAFSAMMEGRTSFVVAHRLSTIREADTILVMDAGHIVESGRHAELLEKGGFYAGLYNSQFAKR